MSYVLLKYVHIFCVATSFSLFFMRGFWTLRAYPPASERWTRMLPHCVDALLLLSAIAMLASAPSLEWPRWMQMKLAVIVIFVALALAAFRSRTSRARKSSAWLLGMLLFLYITTVAVLKHPYGILSLV